MTDSGLDLVLDRPVRGALRIGRIAGIIEDDASAKQLEEQLRAAYYALESGKIDADKSGRHWISTIRRILRQHAGKGA